VYEDDEVLAFMDIKPVNQGHTLVIPKLHYVDIYDSPPDIIAAVYKVTKKLSIIIKEVANADGISIVQQNGKAAGQDIFHLHVHIIPRFEGQKTIRFSELSLANRETLDALAEKIRAKL
jgi:histidine triad (HIT) family protein